MAGNNDITPKERMLKKIRQALLYQNPNKYPNLDLETRILAEEGKIDLENFYLRFKSPNFSSYLFGSRYEAIDALMDIMLKRSWKNIHIADESLRSWFLDLGIHSREVNESDVALSKCSSLIAKTGTVVFNISPSTAYFSSIKNHIIIASYKDVVDELRKAAVQSSGEIPSMTLYITGGERTEPAPDVQVFVFIINDKK